MTYRELIEYCYKTPEYECYINNCPYQKECNAFRDSVGEYPAFLYNALDVDFDAEFEVEE